MYVHRNHNQVLSAHHLRLLGTGLLPAWVGDELNVRVQLPGLTALFQTGGGAQSYHYLTIVEGYGLVCPKRQTVMGERPQNCPNDRRCFVLILRHITHPNKNQRFFQRWTLPEVPTTTGSDEHQTHARCMVFNILLVLTRKVIRAQSRLSNPWSFIKDQWGRSPPMQECLFDHREFIANLEPS